MIEPSNETERRWFNRGRIRALRELDDYLNEHKYPRSNPIRKWASSQNTSSRKVKA